jgi:hypothetical protein
LFWKSGELFHVARPVRFVKGWKGLDRIESAIWRSPRPLDAFLFHAAPVPLDIMNGLTLLETVAFALCRIWVAAFEPEDECPFENRSSSRAGRTSLGKEGLWAPELMAAGKVFCAFTDSCRCGMETLLQLHYPSRHTTLNHIGEGVAHRRLARFVGSTTASTIRHEECKNQWRCGVL